MRRSSPVAAAVLGAVVALAVGGAASAADLSPAPAYTKAPVAAPAPVQSWTGFYVGINAGYGWGSPDVAYTPNDPAAQLGTCGGIGGGTCIPSASVNISGAIAGGQVGYNLQMGPSWLAGIEADLQWADIKGNASSPFHLGSTEDTSMLANEQVKWFGTVRGRLGWIPSNPLLLYATGGLAYGNVSDNLVVPNNIPGIASGGQPGGGFAYICTGGGPPCFLGSSSHTLVGWTVGVGGEYMIWSNFTLKAEYLYVNLGSFTDVATTQKLVPGNAPSSFSANFGDVTFSVARLGLNLKF